MPENSPQKLSKTTVNLIAFFTPALNAAINDHSATILMHTKKGLVEELGLRNISDTRHEADVRSTKNP